MKLVVHAGLKILWAEMLVSVRPRPALQMKRIKLLLDNGIIIEAPYGYSINDILVNLPSDIIEILLK
jgi:hypothetical protein